MNKSQYLTCLADDIEKFSAAAALGLKPKVPGCPAWTVGQLVVHLADVYDWWSNIVEQRLLEPSEIEALQERLKGERAPRESAEFAQSRAALDYFNEQSKRIQDVLAAADPAQPTWAWWPRNQTAAFAQRRMAHESSIHRWDAESAHGVQTPIVPRELASDGVDEAVKNELTGWPDEGKTFPNASFHVHCTDGPGEWMIRAAGKTIKVSDEHAKADLAITGPASSLLLFIWGRIPATQLTLYGNQDLVPAFSALFEME
ncbi:MAG TPA: maleylpyruvate isomerase family mycothiol-dependent enzyme [Chloroflexota bacterium]|jgi:uncharacterized protein (TIGR03083 family)|nr:maleylpyruvate isomerase family mycothiol-dependent enzyme [Chloroflexota bacterium]